MKVQIKDRAAMQSLPIVNLRTYLNSQGWTDIGTWGERPVTIFDKEHDGRTWEILVPHTEDIGGYAEGMAESIAVLAVVEDRSQLDVYYDLLGTGADTIRVRSLNGAEREHLSLGESARLLHNAHSLLASAARAVEKPQAVYRGSVSSDVSKYLDGVRPMPGYYEGYSITLRSPVPTGFGTQADFGDDFSLPFPRAVTTKLSLALNHSRLAVSMSVADDTMEPFRQAVPNGVSANLCRSIAELAKNGGGVEIGLTWAQVRPSNVHAASVQFSEEEADVLIEAAKLLRDEPSIGERIIARVASLEKQPDDFDGRAQLLSVLDDRPVGMTVRFEQPSYNAVIHAFEQREPISVVGDIHPSGNGFELRSPRELSLVS